MMKPNESSEPNAAALVALRGASDAVRVITECLRVKEMGPADHIRTKHEVKAFVAGGNASAAEELLKRARARREVNQNITTRIAQGHGQRMSE